MKMLFVGASNSENAIYRYHILKDIYRDNLSFFDKLNGNVSTFGKIIKSPNGNKSIFQKLRYSVIQIKFLILILRARSLKVIHFHNASNQWISLFAVMFFRGKVVVTPQGSDINQAYRGYNGVFTRLILGRADVITSKSNAMTRRIVKIANKMPISLNWGVSPCFISSLSSIDGVSKSKRPVFLSNRTYGKIYNIDLIIDAALKAQEFADFDFIFCSRLPINNDRLWDIKNVTVYTNIGPNEMAQLLSYADCVVSAPSYDGFSTSLAEALFCGCYLLISDIDAYVDEFDNNDMFVKRFSLNRDSLSDEMISICSNIDKIKLFNDHRKAYALERFGLQSQQSIIKGIYSTFGINHEV